MPGRTGPLQCRGVRRWNGNPDGRTSYTRSCHETSRGQRKGSQSPVQTRPRAGRCSGGETRTLNLAVNSRSLCRLSYPGRLILRPSAPQDGRGHYSVITDVSAVPERPGAGYPRRSGCRPTSAGGGVPVRAEGQEPSMPLAFATRLAFAWPSSHRLALASCPSMGACAFPVFPSVRNPHLRQTAIRPLVSGRWSSSSLLPSGDATGDAAGDSADASGDVSGADMMPPSPGGRSQS